MARPTSRTANSARNAGVSILSQLLTIALGFVTRAVFIRQLGVEMQGVNALLTSTLSLLAFADLGINGAVMYALYKPLRDGETGRVASIVAYATRLFRWVALLVAVIGIAATPFIRHLVQLDDDVPHLEIYYLILLANTVVSYLMLSRMVLLNADQKIYVTKIYSMVFNIVRSVLQIVSLVTLGSFLAFLVIQVIATIANNLVVYLRAGKVYRLLRVRAAPLDPTERSSIVESVRAMVVFRIGGLALHNAPAMLISVIVGTATLGYYSNYMLIVGSAVMITEVAFSSLTPSVGNLVASGDRRAGRHLFDEIVLLALLLYGILSVILIAFVDDFIELWIGIEFQLPPLVIVFIVLNFYVPGTLQPMASFRNATGLFVQTRFVPIVTASIAVILAFTLGEQFGLVGVVAAPLVARLCLSVWYEPWALLRLHLEGAATSYFVIQVKALLLWTLLAVGALSIGSAVSTSMLWGFVAKAAFLVVVTPICIWVVFRRDRAFGMILARLQRLCIRDRPA